MIKSLVFLAMIHHHGHIVNVDIRPSLVPCDYVKFIQEPTYEKDAICVNIGDTPIDTTMTITVTGEVFSLPKRPFGTQTKILSVPKNVCTMLSNNRHAKSQFVDWTISVHCETS